MRCVSLLFVSALLGCPARTTVAPKLPVSAIASLTTEAERSGYVRTGRYDEVLRLCEDFARVDGVFCDRVGTTGEDRPIVAVRIARQPNLPVIFIQAGIHAGEIEGKDAGFAFLRDLLLGKVAPGVLERVAVVFIPVLNPDGHERFGPNHRPNQRGPKEMGFRVNGARQNVNRDFMKADTAEAHAVLGAMRTHDPVMLIDLHATDGAKFEQDISLNFAPVAPRADQLDETITALHDRVMPRMTALGHLPVDFYPSFVDDDDPLSGFDTGEAPPRFSQFYAAARGRLGLLVETHSWRPYKQRAESTYHTLQAVFEAAIDDAAKWRSVADAVSRSETQLAGSKLTLMWKPTKTATPIEFRGYAFEKRTSDLTGGVWLVYDETKPEIWRVPLYNVLEPAVTVDVPRHGYVIDGGFAKAVAPILARHGIRYQRFDKSTVTVEAYRATKVTYGGTFEGRARPALEGAWAQETRTLDQGAIFVPIDQPLARLAIHLLDPALPDALVNWGFFNAVFEQKEYMEGYVVEEEARTMLAKDPALRAQFDADVAKAATEAVPPGGKPPELTTPDGKRKWFYKRHPAWDERVNLVPVYRF